MIRVGLIGCGKIADQHIAQIKRIPDCEIVGVCDQEHLMAKQLHERFQVEDYFSDVRTFIKKAQPDVVHITTPPQTHLQLGLQCLEAGCHVYIEKPFTVNREQAEELFEVATEKGLKLTVGHNLQFTHEAIEMRRLIQNGFLGGPPVHMESHFSYDLADPSYVKILLRDKRHWVRALPGKLLHNVGERNSVGST